MEKIFFKMAQCWRRHKVIVGGGFGGLIMKNRNDVDVIMKHLNVYGYEMMRIVQQTNGNNISRESPSRKQ